MAVPGMVTGGNSTSVHVSTTVSSAIYMLSILVILGFSMGFFITILCKRRRNSSATLNFMKSPLLSYHYKFVFTSQNVETSYWNRFLNLPHLQKPFFLDLLKILFELMAALAISGCVTISGMLGIWILFNLVHFAHVISVGVTSRRSEDFKKASVIVLRSGLIYVVAFCSPLLLVGAAYSAQQWTHSAWYTTLDGVHFARYLMVCLILGSSLCITYLIFVGVYALCDRITRRLRSGPRLVWVVMVAIAHSLGGMVAFALYNTRPWVTLAFMPLALELTALSCALFKEAAAQDEVKRFLGDVTSLIHGAVTLLTVGLVQDFVMHDGQPTDSVGIFSLQIIQAVSTVISIAVTVATDVLIVKDLVDVERLAKRHRSATTILQQPKPVKNDKGAMYDTLKSIRKKLVKRDNDICCCICLEPFTASVTLGVARSCGHHFHFDCINEWMKTKSTCPVCREPITLTGGGLRAMTYWDLKKIMFKSIGRPVTRMCSINSMMEEDGATPNDDILANHFRGQKKKKKGRGRHNEAFAAGEAPPSRPTIITTTAENVPMTSSPPESPSVQDVPTSMEF